MNRNRPRPIQCAGLVAIGRALTRNQGVGQSTYFDPTDGSVLAQKAITHGLSLAKSVGAKVTALTVEASFNVYDVPSSKVHLISKAFAEHAEHAKLRRPSY
jgi:hypothetical protein